MEIIPKLDIDKDIEFLETGSLCHASNVVITNNNDGISNEPAIDVLLELENGERIVGYIACSDEFVIFTSNNKIIRYNEKTKTSEEVKTNWNWEGGKVIGSYTYNVNNELIIAITEIHNNDNKKIPFKVINLDKTYYLINGNDNKYTLAPNIPRFNLINHEFITGGNIYKGVYNLFIRFKLGDNYTNWFSIGYPINVYNINKQIIERNVVGYVTNGINGYSDGAHLLSYQLDEEFDDESEIVNKQIKISIEINNNINNYEYYQIGYCVSTPKGETKIFNTIDYEIGVNTINLDCYKKDDIALDELTRNVFNLYNVKTLCNYNNRLYLANYKEENPNKDIENIDTSNIQVIAKLYDDSTITTKASKLNNIEVLSNNTPKITSSVEIITHHNYKLGKLYVLEGDVKVMIEGKYVIQRVKLLCNRLSNNDGDIGLFIDTHYLLHAFYKLAKVDSYAHPIGKSIFPFMVLSEYKSGYIWYNSYVDYGSARKEWNEVRNILRRQDYQTAMFVGFTGDGIGTTETDDKLKPDNSYSNPIFTNITKYQINTKENSYLDYNPHWFYQGIMTIENIKYETDIFLVPIYNMSTGPTPAVRSYKIYDATTKKVIKYSSRKWLNYVICNTFKLKDDLKIKYPNSTFYLYKYYETTDGNTYPEIDEKNKHTLNLESKDAEYGIVYDTINNKYYFGVDAATWKDGAFQDIYLNKIKIVSSTGEELVKTVEELYPGITITFDRENYTVDDLLNYYEGNGSIVKTVYKWTNDIQPDKEDYKINNIYDVSLIKIADIVIRQDYLINVLENEVRAVGYKNIVETAEGNTHTVTVDKSFCIVIPLIRILSRIKDDNYFEVSEHHNITIEYFKKDNSNERLYYYSTVDKLYALINTKDVVEYNGVTTIDVNICEIYNNQTINDEIPVFKKIYCSNDIDGDRVKIRVNNLLVNSALFYVNKTANKTENEELNIDSKVVTVETKTAINYCVYNFFIHFVYPNGNYTDGVQIKNNRTYNKLLEVGMSKTDNTKLTINLTEDTKFEDIYREISLFEETHGEINIYDTDILGELINTRNNKLNNIRVCNLYPEFTDNVGLYKNSNGDRLFIAQTSTINNSNLANIERLRFIFKNIVIPEPFVGFFISYEKTEPILTGMGIIMPIDYDLNTVGEKATSEIRFYYPEFDINKKTGGNILLTACDRVKAKAKRAKTFKEYYDFELSNSIYVDKDKSSYYTIDESTILIPNDNNNEGREGVLKLKLDRSIAINPYNVNETVGVQNGYLLNITDNIYLSKNKLLVSLGYIQYKENGINVYNYGDINYNYNYNYYNFIHNHYVFNKEGIIYDEVNPQPKTAIGNDLYNNWEVYTGYFTNNRRVPLARISQNYYSLYLLKAKRFNNSPIKRIYTFNYDNNKFVQNDNTIHIYPLYINDMFKLTSCYDDFARKIITNFNKEIYNNFIEYYGRTIRRSDIINDESVENSWRIFRPEEYKIIAENKGNIINLTGIGVYLIAHCEHSMFVFNRNNTMQTKDKDVQLIIPDAFEIDYSEIFTSQKGYAGIQKFNQWCISNYGYIFYDNDSKKLYKYDNNNLDEINVGFDSLFKRDIENINFVIDEDNTRVICIGDIKNGTDNKFAISYNFATKSWISTHSYWYKDCFNTKNNCYFINDNIINSIDTFDKTKFNNYTNIINDDFNIFKSELNEIGKPYSFIDVVFNNNVKDKVLDYITYSVTKNNNDVYSGDKIVIYTNCCNTDYVDISKPRKSIKDYKSPVFKFGVWAFNWFMNKVLNINTNNPINRGNGKFNLDVPLDNRRGLDNKLVVGKYFVVRFIFRDETNKINVNDIQCY